MIGGAPVISPSARYDYLREMDWRQYMPAVNVSLSTFPGRCDASPDIRPCAWGQWDALVAPLLWGLEGHVILSVCASENTVTGAA